MGALAPDLRQALRGLRNHPGATGVAILLLALGIGANTAIFSILDPLLLRKLPVQRPDELIRIGAAGSLGPMEISELSALPIYRDKNQVFSGVFAFAPPQNYEIVQNNQPATAKEEIVSGNYFTVLGVRPFAGRLFTEDDEYGGPVVVLSFDYWKRAYHSDRAIVGKTLPLNNILYTITGIAPPGFFGMEVGKSPDLYLPLTQTGPTHAAWGQIFGRLKPDVSLPQAQTTLASLFQEVVRNSSLPKVEINEWMARLDLTNASRGLSELRTQFSLPVRILMAVVGLILLIACANVANLMLSRGIARRRELSLKQALGAGRWRLARQLLIESILLVTLGTAVGLLVGQWTSRALVAAISSGRLPVVMAAGINGRVLGFAVAVLGLTVLLCGLLPALSATRLELVNDLKVQEAEWAGPRRSRLGNLLIVGQVALSVTVLAGASLLLHSLINLETFDPGFDRDHVLLVSMNAHDALRSANLAAFDEQLEQRIKRLPRVRSVSWSGFPPISGSEVGINITVEGYTLRPGEIAHALFLGISPRYFQTLGIPLLQGRDFTPQDMQFPARVVIINRTMASRFFGNASPLGKHLRMVEGNRPPVEIIGVVADSKYNDLREKPSDFFYIPASFFMGHTLEIRGSGNPRALAASLPGLIRSLNSTMTVTSVKTMREEVDESLRLDRLIATLCGAFGLLALTITCAGLYGTLSFRVVRRTREIGIRMALGAHPRDIFRLVVSQGIFLTFVGAMIGAAGATAATFLLRNQLFGVKQLDPATIVAVPALLLIAAIVACYVPARQAASVEPMRALRME